MSGILDNCVFVIDQFIPLKKKVELIRMIKTNGGISVYSVSEKSTHLITSQEGFLEGSAKVVAAKNLGLHIVSKEFVVDSIAQGAKQDEKLYNFSSTPTPQPPLPSPPPGAHIGPPALTVTISTRPANSPAQISASSPRSPPGFNNIRAPNLQPQTNTNLANLTNLNTNLNSNPNSNLNAANNKLSFGRLRVDTRQSDHRNPLPTPSPKYAQVDIPHQTPKLDNRSEEEDDEDDADDDDDDDGEDEDEESSDEDDRKPSFRDILEMSNRDKQPRAWESATPQYLEDDGCKIFVGGIMFDDLEALKKTKDGYSASEEVIAHIQKLKNERLLEIIRIFSRFGTVVRVKQFLEKRHIFITYDNKNSALQALRTLKPLEVRKKIVQEVRERLRAEDRQTMVSPRSNFYVRWPHHVDSETDGYSSRSYFSSGSSAPSSPTAASLATQKLSWRQPQSPTAAYQPYQRSYFTQNNFTNASRTTSMRSYFDSGSDYESASHNANSFSETEAPCTRATTRSQHYQPPRHNSDISTPSVPSQHSESDSDASSSGIRHRVVDRNIDKTEDISSPTTHTTTTTPAPTHTSTSTTPVDSHPKPTSALLTPVTSTILSPYPHEKRHAVNDEGAWHKVLVLLLILAIMAIVYLYNK